MGATLTQEPQVPGNHTYPVATLTLLFPSNTSTHIIQQGIEYSNKVSFVDPYICKL